ncbi:Crp/Fnr family transcriptional regulator [Sanguibacter hominis ATCC BAA-789]|uniref:Crp/Fnr family transcriptional regulator n=1 Tax=Sanguibacter hominis ATCC BAA-789 TaxID=1312740 RepID=A0A9X5IS50_9MICO|nr:Crp/Fnr family transcriptional regulator [Sanguibacter hominis]NKX92706.1 Crp/Fnr family transcriptional regulator [Sanguibacter hominis ATCC BAA-789]
MSSLPVCVSRVPIFAGLTPVEQREVHDVARPRRLPDGETVYVEGDRVASLLVVNSGRLRLTRSSPDGGEHLLRVLDAGDFIGVESFLTGATPGHTATAMGATVLCEFRHADLQPLLDAHPGVGVAMLATLATQLSRTEERLTAQTLAPVERRLVGYLLDLPAQPHADGLLIELPLSKKDIASYLGTTPESLSRSLRALADAGIVESRGKRELLVRDAAALDDLVR